MPSGNIKTVTFKTNVYTQWLSEYGYNRDTYAAPSGNINAVPEIIKLIRLVAYLNKRVQWLNTAEIENHIHTPSGHINSFNKFNLYVRDNLNTCAIDKYTNTPVVTIIEQQQHGKFLLPVAISIQFENNIYIFYAQWQY